MSKGGKHLAKKRRRYRTMVEINCRRRLILTVIFLLGGIIAAVLCSGAREIPHEECAYTTPTIDRVTEESLPGVIQEGSKQEPPPEPVEIQVPEGLLSETVIRTWADELYVQGLNEEQRSAVCSIVSGVETLCHATTGTGEETLIGMLAKTCTNEIGGLTDTTSLSTAKMEEAAVIWCVLNRATACGTCDPATIVKVCKAPHQFAYNYYTTPDADVVETVEDVLIRWVFEQHIESLDCNIVGRVLPPEYLYFTGDGKHNNFENAWPSGNVWDWSLADPYIN